RRRRTDHRHVDKSVGARAGVRVKNMVKAPARLECRAVTARYGKRHVFQLDHAVDAVRGRAMADAKPPGASVRVMAQRAEFAQIDDGALEAFVAQHVGDGVRDVTLGKAVERYRHAIARESYCSCAAVDLAEINEGACNVARTGREVGLDV